MFLQIVFVVVDIGEYAVPDEGRIGGIKLAGKGQRSEQTLWPYLML